MIITCDDDVFGMNERLLRKTSSLRGRQCSIRQSMKRASLETPRNGGTQYFDFINACYKIDQEVIFLQIIQHCLSSVRCSVGIQYEPRHRRPAVRQHTAARHIGIFER